MKEENQILQMNDQYDENESSQYMKSYMFIKGFAVGRDLKQVIVALSLARQLYEGQYRKDSTPYKSHPLKVCSTLISYGIEDDITLAASLLHDVLEDCEDKLSLCGKELVSEYGKTSIFLIPMASYCKKYYPEYATAFSILKSNIESMNHSMDIMLSKIEAMGDV